MPSPYEVGDEVLSQIAHSFLEVKKMARSIENTVDAFIPLTDDKQVLEALGIIAAHAGAITTQVNPLYHQIAREASSHR